MSYSNQTLDRYNRRDGSLLINPYFQHMNKTPTNVTSELSLTNTRAATHMPLGVMNQFYLTPGWYFFGAWPHAQLEEPTLSDYSSSPLFSNTNMQYYQGVTVSQYGPANGGTIRGGLVQPLPYGDRLFGKKVRISGAFKVTNDSAGNQPCGVSVWLRGQVWQNSVSQYVSTAGDGTVATNSTTMTTSSSTLTAPQGSMLIVPLQNGAEAGVYQVATNANTHTLTIQAPYGTSGFSSNNSNFTYLLSNTSSPEASALDTKAVKISTANKTAGFIVHAGISGGDYGDWRTWFWRGWDYLHAPRLSGGVAPAFVALMWGGYEAQGINEPWGRQKWPTSNMNIYYLDASDWSANGYTQELYTDDGYLADGQVHYFEKVVDISTLSDGFGEYFLVVLPKKPSTALSASTTQFKVTFYALDMELVPESGSAGNGVEDGILRKYLQGGAGGSQTLQKAGSTYLHLLRYPIYEEVMYPLMPFDSVLPSSTTVSMTENVSVSSPSVTWTVSGSGIPTFNMYSRLPYIPPGSHIVKAGLWVQSYTVGGTIVDFYLRMTDSSNGGCAAIADGGPSGGLASKTLVEYPTLYRHRIGFPDSEDTAGYGTKTYGYPSTAQVYNRIQVAGPSSTGFALNVSPGYVIALVDPRMYQGYMVKYGAPG